MKALLSRINKTPVPPSNTLTSASIKNYRSTWNALAGNSNTVFLGHNTAGNAPASGTANNWATTTVTSYPFVSGNPSVPFPSVIYGWTSPPISLLRDIVRQVDRILAKGGEMPSRWCAKTKMCEEFGSIFGLTAYPMDEVPEGMVVVV